MQHLKRRNWTAKAAIIKKGGVHDKTNKAKRQKDKQAFKRKIRAEQFGSFYLYTTTFDVDLASPL